VEGRVNKILNNRNFVVINYGFGFIMEMPFNQAADNNTLLMSLTE